MIPILAFGCHRFEANRIQSSRDIFPDFTRRREPILANEVRVVGISVPIQTGVRRFADQNVVKRCSQAINIGPVIDQITNSPRLLRAHVAQRTAELTIRRRLTPGVEHMSRDHLRLRYLFRSIFSGFDQSPINHNRFAIPVDHDIRWFEIAVQQTMLSESVFNCVACINQMPQQRTNPLQKRFPLEILIDYLADHAGHVLAPDQPHRIIRSTILELAECIHRNDSRMIQQSCDLGFGKEASSAFGDHRHLVANLLNRYRAPQLGVVGFGDDAQAAMPNLFLDLESLGLRMRWKQSFRLGQFPNPFIPFLGKLLISRLQLKITSGQWIRTVLRQAFQAFVD